LRCSKSAVNMAFAGAISSLFDCGRPRKPPTRDGAKPGEDATRSVGATLNHGSDDVPLNDSPNDKATPQLGLGGGQLHISPFAFSPPIDLNTPSEAASTKINAVRSLEHVPEDVPQGRTSPTQGSDHRLSKPVKGTQIEKRILVTADAPDLSLATFDLDLPNLGNTPVEATPVVKAAQTTQSPLDEANKIQPPHVEQDEPIVGQAPAVETTESKPEHGDEETSEVAKAFPFKADEPEVEYVEFESLVVEVATPQGLVESNLSEEILVVPTAISISEPQKDNTAMEVSESQSAEPEVSPAAPAQLLDLPTGTYHSSVYILHC
jgi:hypothetical protein